MILLHPSNTIVSGLQEFISVWQWTALSFVKFVSAVKTLYVEYSM